MAYEELRTLAESHFNRINELNMQVEGLKYDLTAMTRIRDNLKDQLRKKEQDYDDLEKQHELKCEEFNKEREAHLLQIEQNQRLEEEIKNLKR